ncbi:MAG: hypothetical protein LBN18_03300 [Dysgonamonadaceae bacterium]|jgi:hypothetical protein|nr:hypothetical protein [Dysgonamonadaceae bacterium]
MKKIAKNGWILGILFVALTGLNSCSKEDLDGISGNEKGEAIADFTIPVSLPFEQDQSSSLRSIGVPEENTIQTLDILAFRVGDDGKEYFDYSATAREAAGNTNGAARQNYKATVWTRSYRQRFVLITNAREAVTQLLTSSDWKNVEKNTMLASLEFSLGEGNPWNTVSASNYTTFPMWGESEPATITFQSSSIGTVSLLRMVARINVQVDESVSGLTGKFKLKSVRLYNTNTKGRIVPEGNIGVEPTIPASITDYSKRFFGPLVYEDFTAPGKTDVAIRGSIYTFEATAVEDPSQTTCLVIGGVYGTDSQTTYYRVDFMNDNGTTHKSILRNHEYTVNITNVGGSGHETAELAFNGKAVNLQTEILEWDAAGWGNIVLDGQYFLKVSKSEFNFPREALTVERPHNVLYVLTDYISQSGTSGWYIDGITDTDTGTTATWLTTSCTSGAAKDTAKVVLYLDQNNPSGSTRTAKIIFAAGRLRYTVLVEQNTLEGVSITILHALPKAGGGYDVGDPMSDLEIISTFSQPLTPAVVPFYVKWTPASANLIAYRTMVSGVSYAKFEGSEGLFGVIPGQPGGAPLSYLLTSPAVPQEDLNGYLKAMKMVFSVSNGINSEEKSMIVWHIYQP